MTTEVLPAGALNSSAPKDGAFRRRGFVDQLESRTSFLLVFGDLAVFAISLPLTLVIRYQEIPSWAVLQAHLAPFSLLFVLWAIVFLVAGLYDQYVDLERTAIPRRLLKVQAVNVLMAGVIFLLLPLEVSPRGSLVIYFIVSTALLSVWRLYVYLDLIAHHLLDVLLVGRRNEAAIVREVLARNPRFRHVAVKHVDPACYVHAGAAGESIKGHIAARQTEIIIADMNDANVRKLTPIFFDLAFTQGRARFFSLSSFYEQLHHRISPSLITETWLLRNVSAHAPHYAYDLLKRIVDVVGALVLSLPCLLIFPIVAAAIKLEDGGSIFYRSERVGQYGQPIYILKFRTMSGMDAGDEALRSGLSVTKVGKLLRKTRIDELPQIANVLRGDLSFIGPRPEMPALARVYEREIPHYSMRHLIKPGLSGWAQINDFDVPRKGVDVERTIEKLSFDLYYLRHRSFLLDVEIVLRTINTLAARSGT